MRLMLRALRAFISLALISAGWFAVVQIEVSRTINNFVPALERTLEGADLVLVTRALSSTLSSLGYLKSPQAYACQGNVLLIYVPRLAESEPSCEVFGPSISKFTVGAAQELSSFPTKTKLIAQAKVNWLHPFPWIVGGLVWSLYFLISLLIRLQKSRVLMADRLNREKLEGEVILAKRVAHDIRAPLGALNAAVAELKSDDQEVLALIHGAVERIRSIATDLVSRAKREHETSSNQSNILMRFIDQTAVLWALRRPESKIIFCAPERFCFPIKDSDLVRVVSNLIENSFEASSVDSTSVEVLVELKNELEKSTLCLIVRDRGVGANSRILKNIGRLGFSFGTGKQKDSGSGLGVWGIKRCIEPHGGKLTYRQREGGGLEATIEFVTPDQNAQ